MYIRNYRNNPHPDLYMSLLNLVETFETTLDDVYTADAVKRIDAKSKKSNVSCYDVRLLTSARILRGQVYTFCRVEFEKFYANQIAKSIRHSIDICRNEGMLPATELAADKCATIVDFDSVRDSFIVGRTVYDNMKSLFKCPPSTMAALDEKTRIGEQAFQVVKAGMSLAVPKVEVLLNLSLGADEWNELAAFSCDGLRKCVGAANATDVDDFVSVFADLVKKKASSQVSSCYDAVAVIVQQCLADATAAVTLATVQHVLNKFPAQSRSSLAHKFIVDFLTVAHC